jgi:hypothetical protein
MNQGTYIGAFTDEPLAQMAAYESSRAGNQHALPSPIVRHRANFEDTFRAFLLPDW